MKVQSRTRRFCGAACCCSFLFAAYPAYAGKISGTTVSLDGIQIQPGVEISARRINSVGIPDRTIFARAVSGADGRYQIDVGNTPAVQLVFRNGRVSTTLQRLGGLTDITGLIVVAPVSLVEQEYPPCYSPCGPTPLARAVRQRQPKTEIAIAARQPETIPTPQMRTWTNRAGDAVMAKLVRVDGSRAYFERDNGKSASAKVADLSAADQKQVTSWQDSRKLAQAAKTR